MENSLSATTTVPLHLHCLPSNTITSAKHNSFRIFKSRASTQSLSVSCEAPPTLDYKKRKFSADEVKPFAEKDAFHSSLPLHTKHPRSIYKDIKKFARENQLQKALIIMDYMDQRGIPVNPTTFSALIAACIRTKSLKEGREIHTHIRINELEKNEFLRTKLVHMYTSCGAMEDAKHLFEDCSCWSVYPWNALLRGTVIFGKKQHRNVLSTFSEMRALGIELNVYSFSSVITSIAGAPALFQGLKTHALCWKSQPMRSAHDFSIP